MIASQKGHVAVVNYLIQKGAIVTERNNNGKTPLHIAAERGNVETVECIFKNLAKVSTEGDLCPKIAASNLFVTEVRKVSSAPHSSRCFRILYVGRAEAALAIASLNGHTNVVKYLIKKGADINVENSDGWTPLMMASYNGCLAVAKVLVEKHADISKVNKKLETAVHIAAKSGKISIVRLLIESGGNADAKDNEGV
ncbi:unnamed protein product [Enterobius vermicularis]|uniref:ANK_REP_REGION domain-containing protein n=1 Tax=Enterobius vermicularis TaxID=51028 RepID=A0A0N4V855_ENTVE|nr:unnamed protein product [Enterobius vermicularis]